MAKKSEFVLSIGDDNVVLIRLADKRIANAWLASPDPATAHEELGEALAEDTKGRVSVIVDTLDQAFKEEEIPKVNILDRRKILSRHITMAFPGQSMRGARLLGAGDKGNTLLYEFASVPLDGRIPGWIEFYESLPNEKGGVYAIASENVDIIQALAPKEPPSESDVKEPAQAPSSNHWRHLIGINVTGGLRQIISKNGRLSLTRLTQAPPPDTPPDEFADMIIRDFKATITYLRRLGYTVGDPLDLIVLTTSANRDAMERLEWTGTRSVTLLTPYEAGAMLGLGAIGPEDQASCDVLHAAWFANKRNPNLRLTKSVAMGDIRDDLRELAYVVAPYGAGLAAAAVMGWIGIALSGYLGAASEREELQSELAGLNTQLSAELAVVGGLQYDAGRMRNVFEVETAMDRGKIDIIPLFAKVQQSLENDAVVLDVKFLTGSDAKPAGKAGASPPGSANNAGAHNLALRMRLAREITSADDAVKAAARLMKRLTDVLGKEYSVTMTKEPVVAQASQVLTGGLFQGGGTAEGEQGAASIRSDEPFYVEYLISKVGAGR